jgi:hypothetical protein
MFNKSSKPKDETSGHIRSVSEEIRGGEGQLDKEIVAHVMPKRFFPAQPAARKAKGIGLVVLLGGAIFLIAALAFLYFYFTKLGPEQPSGQEKATMSDQSEVTTESQSVTTKETEEKEKEISPEIQAGQEAGEATETKQAEGFVIATTTEETTASTSKEEAGEATSTKKIIATPTPKEYKIAVDSDGDGLSDKEEVLLDCKVNLKDSDGDGYEDLAEVLNLYNPAGSGQIMVNPNIEKYINSKYSYTLYYPYAWPVDEVEGEDSIIFKLDNNQFIQVIIQPNTKGQTIQEWYKEQMGVEAIKDDQMAYKKGWQAVKSEDGLTFYLAKPSDDNIIIVSHSLGTSDILNYKNVFEMMIKSLEMGN